ncbi:Dual specificity phosphatase [Aureococcus anophagefferens]|uniref:protein-tyrosine-phosphatase n=1 Tax=Aureococcus anophagefferens TaxID=44056 RepID=A0ABR1G6B7_AURAN
MGPARIGDLRLYLGDRHDAKDRSLLRSLKITAVLNCTPPRDESSTGCPNFFEKEPAMRYRRVPIFDTQAEDASGHFDGACDFIASRLHHGGVLVHCNRGVSRSATFVVAHLMTSAGLSVDGALDLVRETRPSAAPNDAFLAQLRALEARLDAARAADAKRTGAAPAPAPASCRRRPAAPSARQRAASGSGGARAARARGSGGARATRTGGSGSARAARTGGPGGARGRPARSRRRGPAGASGAAIGPAAGPPPGAKRPPSAPRGPGPRSDLPQSSRRRRAVEVAERTSERALLARGAATWRGRAPWRRPATAAARRRARWSRRACRS